MRIIVLVLVALLLAASNGNAQQTFESMRNSLEKVYTRTQSDGSKKVAKQFRRWEWFWEPRQLPDGTLPTGAMYVEQLNYKRAAKSDNTTQAIPEWKEIGPFAPDLPGYSNVWNGIGRVNCMAFHPSNSTTFWLGSAQGGLWKTTNGGGLWKEVSFGALPQTGVSDIGISASDPNVLYVATGDVEASLPGELSGFPGFTFGVIKSTDGGATWAQTGLSYQPDQNGIVARLWVDPNTPNIVVAATYDGMKRSTDGGKTWTTTNANAAFRDVVSLANSTTVLIASSFNLSGGAAIYRSDNGGASWSLIMQLPSANRIRLAVSKSAPNVVGAIASDAKSNGLSDVYYSNDGGKTFAARNVNLNLLGWSASGNDWQNGGQGFYDLSIAIDPKNDKAWIVGGVNSWRSTNAGTSWVLSNHWTGNSAPWVHADHHYQVYHPVTNTLYDCHDGGIARSTDKGVTWRDISNGLSIQQYYGLAVTEMDSQITLAGAQDNGTARTLNGTTFLHVLDGDGMATAIDYGNPSLMYASQPYGSFYRSMNKGSGWQMISTAAARGESSGAWVSPIMADPNNPSTVYVGYRNVYKSTDAGTSWARLGSIGVNATLRKLAIAPSDSKYLWAAFTSSLYQSTNGGTTWTAVSGVSGFIQDIEVDPDNPKHYWVCFGGFSPTAKVYEILDGKVTNITGTGMPNVPVNAIEFQPGKVGRLFVGTDLGVFVKDEGSGTWEQYGTGMPEAVISGMELIQIADKLRVSTYGRGLWEIDVKQCFAKTPTVTASGPTKFCVGDSVVLTASDGYSTYKWSDGTEGRSVTIRAIGQTGTYSVSVTDANGCKGNSASMEVTVVRAPGKPFVSLRGTDTLRATALGGIESYQWFKDGQLINGATERTYVATASGKYTVLVKNADGCSTLSDEFTFEPTSVDELTERTQLTVWPNPTTGIVHVTLPSATAHTIDVLDLTGATVLSTSVAAQETIAELDLDTHGIASGVYIIQVTGEQGVWSSVVIKR